jgi:hypothetical protein
VAIAAPLFLLSTCIAVVSGNDTGTDAESVSTTTTVLSVGLATLIGLSIWFARGRKKVTVTVSPRGLTHRGRTYALADIDGIEWSFGDKYEVFGDLNFVAGYELGSKLARDATGMVTMVFGDQRITLFSGLGETSTQQAFAALTPHLGKQPNSLRG